jgi:Ca2+-binding RTX toxin-like protein
LISGGTGSDTIYGGDGNDLIIGTVADPNTLLKVPDGANVIYGGNGNDLIAGGTGADHLYGDAGDDVLQGLNGKDVMTGGTGADSFAYINTKESPAGAGRDVITDFSHTQHDVIDLHSIDASTKKSGDQAFAFIGAAAFTHHAGELREAELSTRNVIQADTNGDGKADFEIQLTGHLHLVTGDFIL